MPLLLPHVLSHHSPSSSKHTSPSQSPRLSPQVSGNGPVGSSSTASSSAISLVRPLLGKKSSSTPILPTLKNLAKHHGHGSPKKSQTRPQSPVQAPTCISMSFRIESPPIVLYGPRTESTGALLSGLLQVEIHDPKGMEMKSVHLAIFQRVKCKTPGRRPNPGVHQHQPHKPSALQIQCKQCTVREEELARWDVMPHASRLPKQDHAYPFSHIMPGSLPASTSTSVFDVEYVLSAVAVEANGKIHKITRSVNVSRSILPSGEKTSVRVFPPTPLHGSAVLPSVVYPSSVFSVDLTLEGISANDKEAESLSAGGSKQSRWRMRKINWRIDEVCKMKHMKCASHNSLMGDEEVADLIEETRTLGHGEVKSGWKTDFSGDGKVVMEGMELGANVSQTSCNIDDPTYGLLVNHILVVEIVVAEEALTAKSSGKQAVPTGAARVLRMQFNLNVTERSGLGIAWDDEVPPTYANVPLSPPEYQNVVALPSLEDVAPAYGCDLFVQGINERLSISQL